MDCKEIREMYKLMFAEYPDIVTVKDLQAMLGISRHAAYDLLGEGEISCIRLGNAYRIPKINVINLCSEKSVRSDPRERVGENLAFGKRPARRVNQMCVPWLVCWVMHKPAQRWIFTPTPLTRTSARRRKSWERRLDYEKNQAEPRKQKYLTESTCTLLLP